MSGNKSGGGLAAGDTTYEENIGASMAAERFEKADSSSITDGKSSRKDANKIYQDFVKKPRKADHERVDKNNNNGGAVNEEGAIFKARDGFFPN